VAPIALRAERSAAYAFDQGEAHDTDVDDAVDKDHAKDHGPAAAKPEAKDTAEGAANADATNDHAATDPTASHTGSPADHDEPGIGEEAIGVIPAEDAPPGPPGAGGGPPAKPLKEPPNVAAARPEIGLAQLRGVRPDRLSLLFGQVHTAAGADVAQERTKLQANPPRQMSTGAASAAKGAAAKDGAPGAGADPNVAADAKAHEVPDHPVKGEVPGGESDKQAKQGQAAEQQKSAPQMIASVARSISSWFSSWFGHGEHGEHGDDKTPKMSEAETRRMTGSLDQLPTTAQGVSTDAGPAPEIAMKGEAKDSASKDRAKLEATTAGLETQGRADSRAPMGEDHIETTVAAEELTASSAPGGAAPADAALPTVAGAATSEEVGIVAQEQHGAEIDAAVTKASADATAERAKHTEEETRARAESDAHVRELKAAADADQAAARSSAQAEVQQARGQWQSEIDKKGSDARKQADKKVADGMTQVEAEETKANAEAKRHIDDGKRKAEDEKQKGEKEAADAKDKGKKKSSGFFGWVASKAKAAFDHVKQAVSAAIDACKKAVKAVIDAAKRLAMAAIELARKVIVAAIKAVGQALIAISNVLLAAFPGLKARFQGLIRKAVDKAVETVNKLADGLKKAVQKALDLLGAALDKALGLLEKGINAIIDAANAVVQGAIKAAQAVVDALGTWVKLIKDVATAPGAWLGKLGAAVVDGIKHHLWSAFKTAVVDWFKSKVFELLGVGGIILELLLEGGLTREHIIQMALDALMVAIPAALVAILIEKLVSMIVPAAGAVMAVIEGLQAAWGTISRIIAAFSAFMAFLLAVKGGSAGALFAAVLASAAVVVLDFVANWLLKKLASAARKVGAKLKGMADKFKAKRKAKKDAKAKKKHDEHDGHGGKPQKPHDEHDKKSDKAKEKGKEETPAQKQAHLDAAVAEVKRITKGGKRIGLLLRARLWGIKRKYKLTELSATKQPGKGHIYDIKARINPEAKFEVFALEDDADELRARIQQLFKTIKGKDVQFHEIQRLANQALSQTLGTGRGYEIQWINLDDRHVLMLKNAKVDWNPVPVGAAVYQDEYDKGTPGPAGHLIFTNKRTGTQYVKDQIGQYVPRQIVRAITGEDEHFIKMGAGILPKSDPVYLAKFPFGKRQKSARDLLGHAEGAPLSPYISTTKQQDGEIRNPKGEKFDQRGDGTGKVRIDLAYIAPKNIHDVSTRQGQDFWNFNNPAAGTAALQALKDVVRTSEVLIRGTIPGKAIIEFF
jgi:hypothetical protein